MRKHSRLFAVRRMTTNNPPENLTAPCEHKPDEKTAKDKKSFKFGWSDFEAANMQCAVCQTQLGRMERCTNFVTLSGQWSKVPEVCVHPDWQIRSSTIKMTVSGAESGKLDKYTWGGEAECLRCLQRWAMEGQNGPMGPTYWRKVVKPEAAPKQTNV